MVHALAAEGENPPFYLHKMIFCTIGAGKSQNITEPWCGYSTGSVRAPLTSLDGVLSTVSPSTTATVLTE